MEFDLIDVPRSLGASDAIAARQRMLDEPHMFSLRSYVSRLRLERPDWEFPHFDPMDGGCDADILFLFEKPGPKTSEIGGGSGFISRDNDDPTAEATFKFMRDASLDRKRTVIWNVIPGWNRTRKISSAELQQGIEDLDELLQLLPAVKSIVLVGKRAQKAEKILKPKFQRVIKSPHPSPLVRASHPDQWSAIPHIWSKAIDNIKAGRKAHLG